MLITNKRWRRVIESDAYAKRLKAFVAYCVKKMVSHMYVGRFIMNCIAIAIHNINKFYDTPLHHKIGGNAMIIATIQKKKIQAHWGECNDYKIKMQADLEVDNEEGTTTHL